MTICEVTDDKGKQEFLKVAKDLYRKDNNWTCPLDIEIEHTFDPAYNGCFTQGEACRWVLYSADNQRIGRIAAFYDRNKAFKNDQPTGGVGFFECIDNQEAANLLFDTARGWLAAKGMEAMDGPINFGENFVNQGLLVHGFMPQAYGMPYNFPYYQRLFETYGFQNFFEQLTFHDDLYTPYPARIEKFGDHIIEKGEFVFTHFRMKEKEKFLNDLVTMYNAVWSDFHEGYTPLKFDDMLKIFNEAKALIDERFIWFAYHDGRPVAFLVAFPDVHQLFRKIRGTLTPLAVAKLLFYKYCTHTITRARLLLSGVVPEYQRTGIVTAIYLKLTRTLRQHGIRELDLGWVGDYNLTVRKIYSQYEAQHAKTHITYRYLFDRTKEFKRFTNEHSNKSQKLHRHDREAKS